MSDIFNDWVDLPPICIFMLGILTTYPPYNEMTPEEIWESIKKRFEEAEEKSVEWRGNDW